MFISIFLPRVTRAVVATAATAGLIGFMTAAARPTDARLVPGLAFRISSSLRVFGGDAARGPDDEVMRGRGIAADNRARIEFLAFTPAPQGVTTDDYLIALDSGKSVIQHTATQRYSSGTDMFGGPAVIALGRVLGGGGRGAGGDSTGGGAGRGGRGGRGPGGGGGPPGGARGPRGGRGGRGGTSGFLNQVEVLDVNFKIDKLGAGDAIDGHATQHYRITTDYRVVWGGQGFPAHAVTDVWSTNLPTVIPNPFEPLIVGDQSTDGPLIEYALKLRATRAQIEGTPIKVVTTTTFTGIREIVGFARYVSNDPTIDKVTVVQQTQITSIAPADVDPKLLVVPDSVSADPGN